MKRARPTRFCSAQDCRRLITFLLKRSTPDDKGYLGVIPVDTTSTWPQDTVYDPERHVSHFTTCTHPEIFSRNAAKKREKIKPDPEPSPQLSMFG